MKDPLDNGRTQELPFDAVAEYEKGSQTIAEIAEQVLPPEVSFQQVDLGGIPLEQIIDEPAEFTPLADDKLQAALKEIRGRSFSGRNPTLGKMIKCQVCGRRHRGKPVKASEKGPIIYVTDCQQKFTNVTDGYEYFREAPGAEPGTVTLVPELRTAIHPDLEPTVNQQNGADAVKSRRRKRHFSMKDQQLVQRTRKVFAEMGFTITEGEQAQKNMLQARIEAGRQLRKEAKKRARKFRNQQKRSRKINRRK